MSHGATQEERPSAALEMPRPSPQENGGPNSLSLWERVGVRERGYSVTKPPGTVAEPRGEGATRLDLLPRKTPAARVVAARTANRHR